MINIFSDPETRLTHGKTVSINLNTSTEFEDKTNHVNPGISTHKLGLINVARRLLPDVVQTPEDNMAVLFVDDTVRLDFKKAILWGCQIAGSENLKINKRLVNVRSLTGPDSYIKLGVTGSTYFDSRVLVPWSFGIVKQRPDIQFCLIPGESDTAFLSIKDNLEKLGITVIDPESSIMFQVGAISRSMLVLTSSISHAIYADALGVPVHLFNSRGDINHLRLLARDYYRGSSRQTPEILDFSKTLSVDHFPSIQSGFYDIHAALETCPFELKDEIKKDIEEYFNEAS